MDEFTKELKECAAGLHDGMGGHADYCTELMEHAAVRIELQNLQIQHLEEIVGRPKFIERASLAVSTAVVIWALFDWIF